MLRFLINISVVLLSTVNIKIFANNIDHFEINTLRKEAIFNADKYKEQVNHLSQQSDNSVKQNINSQKEFIEHQQKLITDVHLNSNLNPHMNSGLNSNMNPDSRYKTKLLVFISFSMPDEAIKELLIETQKYDAGLIIQGLKDDSFDETVKKISGLIEKAGNVGGIQIDPSLFNKYKVNEVPTYILKENTSYDAKYDSLVGASGISHALEIFKKHGEVKI